GRVLAASPRTPVPTVKAHDAMLVIFPHSIYERLLDLRLGLPPLRQGSRQRPSVSRKVDLGHRMQLLQRRRLASLLAAWRVTHMRVVVKELARHLYERRTLHHRPSPGGLLSLEQLRPDELAHRLRVLPYNCGLHELWVVLRNLGHNATLLGILLIADLNVVVAVSFESDRMATTTLADAG